MLRRVLSLLPKLHLHIFTFTSWLKLLKALEDISWEVMRQTEHLGPQDLANILVILVIVVIIVIV